MNWNKIKEQYPKAIELLDDWVYENHPDIAFKNIFYFLEYFFDEQGIYIDVQPNLITPDLINKRKLKFSCEVYTNQGEFLYEECGKTFWDTRTEAEEKAFEKAFEILELKLAV